MTAGVVRPDVGRLQAGVEEGLARQGVPGGGPGRGEGEGAALEVLDGLQGRVLGDPDPGGVAGDLAVLVAEGGDGLGLGPLAGEDVSERPEHREVELAVLHGEDFGRVVVRDRQLDLAVKGLPEGVGQDLRRRGELVGVLEGLDPEANPAVGAGRGGLRALVGRVAPAGGEAECRDEQEGGGEGEATDGHGDSGRVERNAGRVVRGEGPKAATIKVAVRATPGQYLYLQVAKCSPGGQRGAPLGRRHRWCEGWCGESCGGRRCGRGWPRRGSPRRAGRRPG
ncbi:hypothetical protein GA0115252_12558 [Streptomyces sp. DfronAA-171]|nr:hypothetical protein GA0115252_12558 [Streptomyces sp. DfronAA-171]